jgi:flagellar hook-basal body complex protein FliE
MAPVTTYRSVSLRVAARYQRAFQPTSIEFTSPEAMRDYMKQHPAADPANHSVKKPGEHQPEHETEAKKPSFSERLKSISQKAKSFLSNAPAEIQKFVHDDAHRRGVLTSMSKKLEDLPAKVYENAKHAIKHEIHEFKTAGEGIKAVLKGDKMTPEQKKAVKLVAFDVALTVATVAITGGLGAGLKGVAMKSAQSFTTAMAKKIALNTVTHGLGNLTTVEELGHFGHGVAEVLERVLHAAEKDQDERDIMVAYITKLVSDEIKGLDADSMAEALEGASGDA